MARRRAQVVTYLISFLLTTVFKWGVILILLMKPRFRDAAVSRSLV